MRRIYTDYYTFFILWNARPIIVLHRSSSYTDAQPKGEQKQEVGAYLHCRIRSRYIIYTAVLKKTRNELVQFLLTTLELAVSCDSDHEL